MDARVSPDTGDDDGKDSDNEVVPLWTYRNTVKWIEERFEKDDFFCYEVTETFPFVIKLLMTSFWKLLWFFIAVYIAVQYYINDQGGLYVSLQYDAVNCVQVPIALFGTWQLDRNGYWLGNSAFELTEAFVEITLFDLTVTTTQFDTFMVDVTRMVSEASLISSTRELSANLAYLMTFQKNIATTDVQGKSSEQTVTFTADAAFVFDRFYQVAGLSDVGSDCNLFIDVSYERDRAEVTAQLPYADYSKSALCNTTVNTNYLGYLPNRSGPNIKLKFDMHALMLAYSINVGIVPFSTLTQITNPEHDLRLFHYAGDTYSMAIGIETKYPGMAPVFCLNPVTLTQTAEFYSFKHICLIQVGEVFVYPFFNHIGVAGTLGYDIYTPKQCDCQDGTGLSPKCSEFDFLAGFIMFEEPTLELTAARVLAMVYRNTPDDINDMVFNASFAGIVLEGSPEFANPNAASADPAAKALLTDPAWRNDAYEFCHNCSILTVNFYDTHNHRVNADGLQLYNGSCRDVIGPKGSNGWSDVLPPTKLVHDYYECHSSIYDSIVNGIGIGTSDAAMFVPTLIVLMVPLVHLILFFTQSRQSKESEKDRFDQVFSIKPGHEGRNGSFFSGWVWPKEDDNKGSQDGAKHGGGQQELATLPKSELNL